MVVAPDETSGSQWKKFRTNEYGSSQPILEIRYDDSPALVSGHTCNTSPAPLSSRYYDTGNRSVGIVADPPLIVWESTTFQYRRNQRTDVCAADVGWHMNRYGNGGEAGQLTLWGHYACSSTPGQTCHPMNELSFNDAVNHHIEDYRNYPTALYGLPSQYYYRFRAFWDVVDNQGFGMAFGCYPVGCISVAQERWQ